MMISKRTKEALFLTLGCVMLTAGTQLTFGTGWTLIVGGVCWIMVYWLEANKP